MTKEKATAERDPNVEAKEEMVSPEKPTAAPTASSLDPNGRDEKDRRAVIFASVLLMLLAAPVFLPMDGERSFLRATRYELSALAMLAVVFGWPVCLGIVGILRARRRNVPGKGLMGIATAFTTIQTLAGVVLMTMLLWNGQREARSPIVWLGALCAAIALFVVVRSFSRTGWQRWQHLMAPIALLAVMIVLILVGVDRNAIEHVPQGGWFFLFATAALVPFIGRTIVSRPN